MLLQYARRLIRGVARGLVGAVLVFSIVGYGVINSASHYAARWHVDPSTIEPRGTPNEYFVAPRGTTSAEHHADAVGGVGGLAGVLVPEPQLEVPALPGEEDLPLG